MKIDNMMVTKCEIRDNLPESKQERLMQGVDIWTSFYRQNPARFFQDYFGLELHPFQVYMFNMIDKHDGSSWITTRGLGKSFTIAGYLVTRAVLYPGSKIVVSCETIDQASQLVREKIDVEMMRKSPNLAREIEKISTSDKGIKVIFKNNSFIEAINADENTRSRRANILCVDEYVLIKGGFETLNKVLKPFLQVPRQPPYLKKQKYKKMTERNKQIYLTSGFYTSHWSYDLYAEYRNKMLNNENFYAGNFSWHLGRYHSLVSDERLYEINEYKEKDRSTYVMEYCGQFYKLADGAYISPNDFMNARTEVDYWIPPTNIEYISEKKIDFKKRSYYLPHIEGEKRILTCDIATMSSTSKVTNDASAYTIIRAIPKGDDYICTPIYQETYEGAKFGDQAIYINRLFEDADCDYLVLDCGGIGKSLLETLGTYIVDKDRGVTYTPMKCFNNEKFEGLCAYNEAYPVIYGFSGTDEINSEMAVALKNSIENKKIKFLVNEREAKEYLIKHKEFKKYDEDPDKQARMLMPFVQSTLLQNEVVTLKTELIKGKYIRLVPVGRGRKDRASSLLMGIYFIQRELEPKLRKPKKTGYLPCLW